MAHKSRSSSLVQAFGWYAEESGAHLYCPEHSPQPFSRTYALAITNAQRTLCKPCRKSAAKYLRMVRDEVPQWEASMPEVPGVPLPSPQAQAVLYAAAAATAALTEQGRELNEAELTFVRKAPRAKSPGAGAGVPSGALCPGERRPGVPLATPSAKPAPKGGKPSDKPLSLGPGSSNAPPADSNAPI